jgi:hypothetical protein
MFHDVGGWVMLVVGYLLLMGGIRLIGWIAAPAERSGVVVVGGAMGK